MDNVARVVCLQNLNISVNGETIFENPEKEQIRRNLRETHIYDFVYQMLVENTDSDWKYESYDDMYARGIRRRYRFYNPQGDMAVVTVFFVPYD